MRWVSVSRLARTTAKPGRAILPVNRAQDGSGQGLQPRQRQWVVGVVSTLTPGWLMVSYRHNISCFRRVCVAAARRISFDQGQNIRFQEASRALAPR